MEKNEGTGQPGCVAKVGTSALYIVYFLYQRDPISSHRNGLESRNQLGGSTDATQSDNDTAVLFLSPSTSKQFELTAQGTKLSCKCAV